MLASAGDMLGSGDKKLRASLGQGDQSINRFVTHIHPRLA
jgi:hypothetical protein